MFSRLKRIWRPEAFHFHHALGSRKSYFEGWYFKLVDREGAQPYAIIPGVFLGEDAHAFIQVLDGRLGTSDYHRFPLEAFRASRDRLDVTIGRSHFTRHGITLDIRSDETSIGKEVKGTIEFLDWHPWPVTTTSPGVMGPYSFMPLIECNHGILSMDHALAGELSVAGSPTGFHGGRGYVEKDWGRSFPRGYVWAQSNHFAEPGVSISASVAHIPWLTGAFRGYLIGFLLEGRLHRFTTYNGATVEQAEVDEHSYHLSVRNHEYRLTLCAEKREGALLHAPYGQQMVERVAESMDSTVDVRLETLAGGNALFEGRGRHCCLEVQGDLDAVLDRTG